MKNAFVQYFIMLLVAIIIFFYALYQGLPQSIWLNDASHFTSVIWLVLLYSLFRIGKQSWELNWRNCDKILADDWGVFATYACPMLGIIGTTYGLSLQATVLASGSVGLVPLTTSLYTTMVGAGAGLMVYLFHYTLVAHAKKLSS